MKKIVSTKRFLVACFNMLMPVFGILAYYFSNNIDFLFASVTFGDTTAPSDITTYLDAVFSQSLSEYRKTLTDNIGLSNAFFHVMMKGDLYESYEGGLDIREDLMYELAPMDWYDGYDELPDNPTDGVTQAVYVSAQAAVPISYSMREVIQNKHRITNLVKTKMTQAEIGVQEGFAKAFMRGAATTSASSAALLRTPITGGTGATGIDPIGKIIDYVPSGSRTVGNINQSTSSWWRNVTKSSQAVTYDDFLLEWMNFYNTCSLGTGGPPEVFFCDQTTYELASFALYQRYRQTSSDQSFPFTNLKLPFGNGKSIITLDELTPDVASGAVTTGTYGTMYAINSKFMRIRYIPERDFEMLKDENGKTFVKPIKGDSRLGHIGWMGAITTNNRRKLGVFGQIPRTLTAS